MKRLRLYAVILFAANVMCASCGTDGDTGNAWLLALLNGSRNYYMGLTPFPFDISGVDKVEYVYDKIETDADLIAHHFDNGIPWDDALADTYPYTAKIMDDWAFRKSHTPAGHKLYVAITPINSMRDGLAPDWNSTGDNQPLAAPWNGYTFNHNNVKTAYLNYCRRVIDYFNPDYMAVGIEVNLVMANIEAQWPAYLELQQGIYAALKTDYPDLPIFITLTGIDLVEGYSGANHENQEQALAEIIGCTDYYAVSLHPFFAQILDVPDPFPDDMFDRIFSLNTGEKPACITETSFPAEGLTMTAYDPDIVFYGTPEKQRQYISFLLDEAQRLNLLFVVNFLVRDYDALWVQMGSPEDILKAWKDTGFYDEAGLARPALNEWKARLALPVK